MLTEIVKYSVILIVLILIQKTLIAFIGLSKYNIQPDVVIIAIVYLGIRKGHIFGMIFGFFAGLVMDILGGSFIGLLSLTYCISGFVAGYFHDDMEKYLYKFHFLFVLLIISIVNYFIYFMIYFQGAPISFVEILLTFVLSTTVYTGVISLIYVFMPVKGELKRGM